MILRKAVVRDKRQRWLRAAWRGLWGAPLVLGSLVLGGLDGASLVEARPVSVGKAPGRPVSSGSVTRGSGPATDSVPAADAVVEMAPEPGAAALLDAQPLQVGLMNHGWPGPAALPLEEESAPATAPATAPASATPTPTPAPVEPQQVGPPIQPAPTQTPSPPAVPRPATGGAPDGKGPLPVSRQLVLDRRHKVLRVIEGNRVVRRYPVAVGMPGWETPVGQFSVIEKRANPTWEHPASGHLLPPGPQNPLGSRWIGFHRDCRGRSGFNGQEHLVVKGCVEAGFHGTPNRASVGRAVSHGCVRLLDEHAKELFDLVSLGTPVIVLP